MSTLTLDVTKLKGALPPELGPIIDGLLEVLGHWTQDRVDEWLALAKADQDAAIAVLLAAMSDEALDAEIERAGEANDARVVANADDMAKQRQLLKDFWAVILVIIAAAVKVAL